MPKTKFRGDRRYAVLVDVGTEWPEVVFVGSNVARGVDLVRELMDRDVATSMQAVVTVEEILEGGGLVPAKFRGECPHGVKRDSDSTAELRMVAGQLMFCRCCGNGSVLGMNEDGLCPKCESPPSSFQGTR